MKEQLTQYVSLLFAGAPDAEDIKQEIMQNTLDRYDDLISQGKSPEAAYRLAISGIGDINEIISGSLPHASADPGIAPAVKSAISDEVQQIQHRKMRAVAVAMYILCPIPLFILSEFGMETLGLCMTLLLVAAATALIMMARKNDDAEEPSHREPAYLTPQQELRKSIDKVISAVGLAVYLIVSFITQAWFSTWLIFPIVGCVKGLVNAILDLKEATEHEA